MSDLTRAGLSAWAKEQSAWKRQEAHDGTNAQWDGCDYAAEQAANFDAIAALLDAQGWQPIATAPKDYSFILVFLPGSSRSVQSVQWAQSYEEDMVGFWATPFGPAGRGYTVLIDAPTHWMPLPAPPVEEVK